MKKFSVILISLSCLLIGLITGILTNGWSESTEDHRNTTYSVSFDETFDGLDYTDPNLYNAEKHEIFEAKCNMVRAHNLYRINQIIQTATKENKPLWRWEKSAWDELSNEIIQFIDAKSTEQWETGKNGTALASYYLSCQCDMEIARATFLETIICDSDSIIKDSRLLSNLSYDPTPIPLFDTPNTLFSDLSIYLDAYISNAVYFELYWHNENTQFSQWLDSTSNLVMSLKNHLNKYVKIINYALGSTCSHNTTFLQKWILQQIAQTIRRD